MKKTLPLLIKNVLLPLLFTLPGILSNREANDLQITSHQTPGTLYTTSTLDTDSRWNPAPKSSQQQRWNLDSSRTHHSSDDSALAIQSGEEDVEEVRGRTQVNTQQEDSTRKNQHKINAQQEDPTQRNQLKFNTRQEDQTQRSQLKFNTQQEDSTQKNQLLEENNGGKGEEAEQSSQTTTVYMPTYFSYGTTRRANYRDRVNSNRNFNGRINQEAENGTSFVNGRRNNFDRNNTGFVNDKRSRNPEDQEYGRISSRVVGRSNNDEDHVEDSTSVVNSRSNNNYDVEDGRRSTSRTNNHKENGNTVTLPPISNQPTMTYSSDFLKLTSPKLSTFGRRVNSTDDNHFTKTQLPSTTDRLPESQTFIKYTTNANENGGRGGRILTGRRKVNESATTQANSDRYLERIHQQIQASTFSPFSTTSYHDANKNLEYKKKPIKKETEGDMVLASGGGKGGGKGGEKLHVAKTETQKTTEIWDKIHKDLVKNKENMTQKPIEVLDERYSTIIDTLSKGSGNVPQSIISQKNVTINNEPGTNLLENENAGSKENNEKRETKEKDVDETKSRGDVIPVIIKNSVVGEGVSDLLNKTVNFRYPDDVKPSNESLFSSGTNGGEFSLSKTDEKSGDKNLETNERIIPQTEVDQVLSGREAEAEKDEQEIKKKIYNLKKPLLPTSGGKVEDGFEVMLKNGSSSDSVKDDVTYFSSSVPSLELNKTATHEGNRSKLVEQDETKTEEENGTKMNELRETRIISSTSRITSSFSSNKLGPTIQQQYTTFASNNLENNIITTSSPLVYGGFTSTTPRVNHYFSMRTSTTVQSQPATSAGENLIKQISSFNPRKRPAVTYYQTPAPQLSTKKSPEMFGTEESSIETEGASSFTPGHHSSSTSMRTDTVRKIVPWSTRLQKTTLLPESTTMDYSDETTSTTFSYKASSVASPDWSLASSEVLPTEKTFSTTFRLPTATFVTSETPSGNTWTPLGKTTSRSVDETSSVTDSSGQASPASNVAPGRSTKPAVDASVYPGSRATVTYLDDTTIVPTSSSQSFSITTAESPISSVVDIFENTTTDASPSVNSSIRWGTASSGVDSAKKNTSSASEPSVNSSFSWGTTSSGLDLSDSAKEHTTSTLEPSVNSSISWGTTTETVDSSNDPDEPMLTTSNYPHPESTSTWETGNTATDLQINNKTTVEPSSSPSYDLETNKSDDMVDSTTWSSYGDGNSTEDLQFGDVGGDSGRWKSTTTSEETTVSASDESGGNESIRPVITSRIPDNLTSTSVMPPLSRPVVTSTMLENSTSTSVIPPITRQNFMSNSISKQISTSGPNSTLNTNITSTTKTPETAEDSFETDEEEIQTTTSVPTEGGEYEQEDDDKTTPKPDKDNRIVPKGNEEEITTQRNNFIMKISTTESPLSTHLWTTDSEAETTTAGEVSSKLNETSSTTTPSTVSVESVKTTPMQRPIKPVTIEPDPHTTNPQYIMGLSLLIKGSTLQEICDSQSSLKKAIVFLFRNTTGRILYEDQIVFPNLTPEECKGAKAFKNGYHNIDMMLFDENGNFDDELNSEFRKLWENNGLRTNIAIHDVYLILRPQEDVQTSGMTIAVIVIACIGLTCLLLFFILMMILRKRQKKFNYGQRCTPVSLDDYSLDNISVYNSIRRKNARRASKRSYGNPAFDDPSAPSNQMNFAALSHFCSNRTAMDDEFDEIPKFSAKMDELPPGAETRNRYANVIPLPETRVQLAVREGDDPVTGYINANYVKGPKGAAKFYIACQAPMQSTVNDFWRMIWEQQSKLILMLTDLHENGVEKCFDYLPPSEVLDCHRLFGDYQVTLKKREVREKYVISHLQLKNLDSNLWREVTHLWYTSWPHQGTPTEGASMIAYLIEARAFMRNSNGPHIVHCSPGVGRTGTVLAIDLCIREFETCRMVDVPKTVSSLRRDRAGCVQTKDQYAFIYMVLNVYGTKLTGGALDSM